MGEIEILAVLWPFQTIENPTQRTRFITFQEKNFSKIIKVSIDTSMEELWYVVTAKNKFENRGESNFKQFEQFQIISILMQRTEEIVIN